MPSYGGQGKTFLKSIGKWVTAKKERVYDYDAMTPEQMRSAALIISFFRWYPDYFYDLIRDKGAKYRLELVQRILLRIFARYQNVYCTGTRGLTKTYGLMLSKGHQGIFFPGEIVRYVAPAQKQSALLAASAFKTMCDNYPLMGAWWNKNNDQLGMFRISTDYGSEFTMYAPKGDTCSALVGEELAQTGFDFENFSEIVTKTKRLERMVHGLPDRTHQVINLQEIYISNASSRQNDAYKVYRKAALDAMLHGKEYDGYCVDISWVTALLCGIRSVTYYKMERQKSTNETWLREMCSEYTGTDENPLIDDKTLYAARKNPVAELKHSGDLDAIYIVAHDVSYAEGKINAQCADIVFKLTRYKNASRRDKFRVRQVFADAYPPPPTDYFQAQRIRDLWKRYSITGGQPTYIVVDAAAYGTGVIEELMKPPTDGLPALCCRNHKFKEIEQAGALPVIYPLKAGSRGTADEDGEMIKFAQAEFEQGYVELLISNALEGVENFKKQHGIKDTRNDAAIVLPYKKTDELCRQIGNLTAKVSGLTFKEARRSKHIQRDLWSATKYGLRMVNILEDELKKEKYGQKSSWADIIESGALPTANIGMANPYMGDRARLLAMRKGK